MNYGDPVIAAIYYQNDVFYLHLVPTYNTSPPGCRNPVRPAFFVNYRAAFA